MKYDLTAIISETKELFKENELPEPELEECEKGVIAYSNLPFTAEDGRGIDLCLKLIPGTPSKIEAGLRVYEKDDSTNTHTTLIDHICRTGLSSGSEMIPATILNYTITMNNLVNDEISTYSLQIIPHIMMAVHKSANKLGVSANQIDEIIYNKLKGDLQGVIENIHNLNARNKTYNKVINAFSNKSKKYKINLNKLKSMMGRVVTASNVIEKSDLEELIERSSVTIDGLTNEIKNNEKDLETMYKFLFSGVLVNCANLNEMYSSELVMMISQPELIPYLANTLREEYLENGFKNLLVIIGLSYSYLARVKKEVMPEVMITSLKNSQLKYLKIMYDKFKLPEIELSKEAFDKEVIELLEKNKVFSAEFLSKISGHKLKISKQAYERIAEQMVSLGWADGINKLIQLTDPERYHENVTSRGYSYQDEWFLYVNWDMKDMIPKVSEEIFRKGIIKALVNNRLREALGLQGLLRMEMPEIPDLIYNETMRSNIVQGKGELVYKLKQLVSKPVNIHDIDYAYGLIAALSDLLSEGWIRNDWKKDVQGIVKSVDRPVPYIANHTVMKKMLFKADNNSDSIEFIIKLFGKSVFDEMYTEAIKFAMLNGNIYKLEGLLEIAEEETLDLPEELIQEGYEKAFRLRKKDHDQHAGWRLGRIEKLKRMLGGKLPELPSGLFETEINNLLEYAEEKPKFFNKMELYKHFFELHDLLEKSYPRISADTINKLIPEYLINCRRNDTFAKLVGRRDGDLKQLPAETLNECFFNLIKLHMPRSVEVYFDFKEITDEDEKNKKYNEIRNETFQYVEKDVLIKMRTIMDNRWTEILENFDEFFKKIFLERVEKWYGKSLPEINKLEDPSYGKDLEGIKDILDAFERLNELRTTQDEILDIN